MGRKSSIDTLSNEQRTHIEMRLRENRLTLDELIADLQEKFPNEENPTRSALGRRKQSFEEVAKRMREQDAMARMVVAELGEQPDEKAGALLVQLVTTITTNAAINANEEDDVDTKDIGRLARAAKDIMHTRKLTREERHQIRKEAQDELLRQQNENLEATAKTQGMSAEQVNFWREKVLGIK